VTQPFIVEIYGQRYTLRGEAEPAYVQDLARRVDEQMRALARGMKTATPTKLAVLAALNLAHELQQVTQHQHESGEEIDRRAVGLIQSIEEALGGSR
jgi:cell division protein ZapA